MKPLRKRMAGLLMVGLVTALPASALDFNFKGLGLDKLVGTLEKAKDTQAVDEPREIELGAGVAANLLGAASLVKNDALQRYVNNVGRWLALHSERAALPWNFGVLDSNGVNAFATPGGYVFITHGLLQKMRSEHELAGVLAHEIAHVLRKHHLTAIQSAAKTGLATDVLGLLMAKRSDAKDWNKVLSAGTELYARGLDKDDEFEADRMGIVIATRAGYDPFGLPAVLQTLDALNAQDSSLALMFKTHPTPAARLSALDGVMGAQFDGYANVNTNTQLLRFQQAIK